MQFSIPRAVIKNNYQLTSLGVLFLCGGGFCNFGQVYRFWRFNTFGKFIDMIDLVKYIWSI